jgi:alpha-D-xyloside xylohydrolase
MRSGRYRLLPFFYAHPGKWPAGVPHSFTRQPWFFPQTQARDPRDQFLFGRSLMVSPVVEKGAVARSVYLPGARSW